MTLIYIDIQNNNYDKILESLTSVRVCGTITENYKNLMICNPNYQDCKEIFEKTNFILGIIYNNIFYIGKYPNSFKNKKGITCPNDLPIDDIFKCLSGNGPIKIS